METKIELFPSWAGTAIRKTGNRFFSGGKEPWTIS